MTRDLIIAGWTVLCVSSFHGRRGGWLWTAASVGLMVAL